jgi:hypothetical protein
VEGLGKEEVARIMYTHVSTCKNDKIKFKKRKKLDIYFSYNIFNTAAITVFI